MITTQEEIVDSFFTALRQDLRIGAAFLLLFVAIALSVLCVPPAQADRKIFPPRQSGDLLCECSFVRYEGSLWWIETILDSADAQGLEWVIPQHFGLGMCMIAEKKAGEWLVLLNPTIAEVEGEELEMYWRDDLLCNERRRVRYSESVQLNAMTRGQQTFTEQRRGMDAYQIQYFMEVLQGKELCN